MAIALSIFAVTPILGWSFYSEKCVEFSFGPKMKTSNRILRRLAAALDASTDLGFI